ncbi:MAG: isoprenylcysteine carboxylmethyltransferase family protein [Candidatus Diapherotrites archaeon]|nr:isoprenylcysteine carboxylmethyltransferase family protein [Candidatus Diapherotrites archaeon]
MPKAMTIPYLLAVFALSMLLLGALLFVPASTLNWPEAWLLLGLFACYFVTAGLWLGKNRPETIKKRTSLKMPVKSWDTIVVSSMGITLLAVLPVAALDSVAFRLSAVPLEVKALGFAGVALSLGVMFWAIKENAFASRIVEMQKGQKVVSTGPYAIVRHPMYSAFSVMVVGMALALGSLYALLPAALTIFGLFARTVLEDRDLQKGLAGYKEYAKNVRYRLLPGVW